MAKKQKSTVGAVPRRKFIALSAATAGIVGQMGDLGASASGAVAQPETKKTKTNTKQGPLQGYYSGANLNRIAFPMGGLGAGMICLEGTGALSHFSLRHRPEVFNEPCTFAAISIKGKAKAARVLEGPVPGWKLFGSPNAGNGAPGTSFGLPRFRQASFNVEFPFAEVSLADKDVPVTVKIRGWSPFEPGDADNSSLPVAALEYTFTNKSRETLDAVFSYNARNFMAVGQNEQAVKSIAGGFVLWGGAPKDKPWEEGAFSAAVSDAAVKVNHAWFRGGWWDPLTMAWRDIQEGAAYDRPPVQQGGASPGATLFVPFELAPGASKTIALRLCWYVGKTNLRAGTDVPNASFPTSERYRPWYAERFDGIQSLADYWKSQYPVLLEKSLMFRQAFYNSTLPREVVQAVAANLTILKSPTVLRQADGRLWAWEGCSDNSGCCHGSCTHVWNYAQAIPHLFPNLERTLRETEFGFSQNDEGHQTFRSALPIRLVAHDFHAAADGQLGGIMKVFREWRICGDTGWLKKLWPKVRKSMDYCIQTWDPDKKGVLEEPHHNTYDIEFWGPDGMCTSFYLGALAAAVKMGQALGEDVTVYRELLSKGAQKTESELFDGEYFIQKIEWKNLKAKNPVEAKSFGGSYSPEAIKLLEKEGPKYQYGSGCLADGVLGSWMALACGVGQVLDPVKIRSHLKAVHKYNLKRDLSDFANPQRPSYACGTDGGLLICTWPKGGELSLPFVYSNEVWTGIEYQVAAHLMMMGCVAEGVEIVRVCRNRYDGSVRNPFNEYECGHWYARAMSSYALIQGLTGARYDAVEKTLYLSPKIKGNFQSFFATEGSYGTVGIKSGKPFYQPVSGNLEIKEIKLA